MTAVNWALLGILVAIFGASVAHSARRALAIQRRPAPVDRMWIRAQITTYHMVNGVEVDRRPAYPIARMAVQMRQAFRAMSDMRDALAKASRMAETIQATKTGIGAR